MDKEKLKDLNDFRNELHISIMLFRNILIHSMLYCKSRSTEDENVIYLAKESMKRVDPRFIKNRFNQRNSPQAYGKSIVLKTAQELGIVESNERKVG